MIPIWHESAACVDQLELFDASDFAGNDRIYDKTAKETIAKARLVCFSCPVRQICLSSAMEEEKFDNLAGRTGIRGGFTARERMQLAAKDRECALCHKENTSKAENMSHYRVTCSSCTVKLNAEPENKYLTLI